LAKKNGNATHTAGLVVLVMLRRSDNSPAIEVDADYVLDDDVISTSQ
jgi:hypothetical protein